MKTQHRKLPSTDGKIQTQHVLDSYLSTQHMLCQPWDLQTREDFKTEVIRVWGSGGLGIRFQRLFCLLLVTFRKWKCVHHNSIFMTNTFNPSMYTVEVWNVKLFFMKMPVLKFKFLIQYLCHPVQPPLPPPHFLKHTCKFTYLLHASITLTCIDLM